MSKITTHALDLSLGQPAAGLAVVLQQQLDDGAWRTLARTETDDLGRVGDFRSGPLQSGVYRLRFDTGAYFEAGGRHGFFPWVEIAFRVEVAAEHHHVPLLLSPYGYSTYRGG